MDCALEVLAEADPKFDLEPAERDILIHVDLQFRISLSSVVIVAFARVAEVILGKFDYPIAKKIDWF